jgi:hypothetical protein
MYDVVRVLQGHISFFVDFFRYYDSHHDSNFSFAQIQHFYSCFGLLYGEEDRTRGPHRSRKKGPTKKQAIRTVFVQ